MRVKSKPFFTDFRWTWLGSVAKPTYSLSSCGQRGHGTGDVIIPPHPPSQEATPFPLLPCSGPPGLEHGRMQPWLPKPLGFGGWEHPPMPPLQPLPPCSPLSPRAHLAPRRSRRGPAAPRGSVGGWGWGAVGLRCAAGNPRAETGRRSWHPSRQQVRQGGPCPHHRGGGQDPDGSPGAPPSWGCRLVGNPAGAGSAQPPPSPPSGNALSGDQGRR